MRDDLPITTETAMQNLKLITVTPDIFSTTIDRENASCDSQTAATPPIV